MSEASVLHRLIIRHPSRAALAVAAGPCLPSFVAADRHTAEVDYINADVLARWGLVTSVLRSLRHELDPSSDIVTRTHELEVHGADPVLPASLRWCGPEIASSLPAGDAENVADWFAAERAGRAEPEWARPGWFAEARAWIEQRVSEAGADPLREIVQLRAWASSCVLQVRTARGDLYFKAVPHRCHEWAVAQYLARHFGASVPRLLATDAERRWLLMYGFDGPRLEDVGDARAWLRAVTMYARLQVACMTRTDELRAIGCPERGLDRLAAAIEPFAADDAALRTGATDGLSADDAERFRSLVPDLRRRCAALAAEAIPLTLEHGDLWPGNFLISDTGCVLIDWEDAAIGHPFFSLAPLLVGLSTYQPALNTPAVVRALQDAYLTAFADFGAPEQLRAALALATPLSFIDMALRYRNQPPSMVRLHPWMRDLVPQTLRLALAADRYLSINAITAHRP